MIKLWRRNIYWNELRSQSLVESNSGLSNKRYRLAGSQIPLWSTNPSLVSKSHFADKPILTDKSTFGRQNSRCWLAKLEERRLADFTEKSWPLSDCRSFFKRDEGKGGERRLVAGRQINRQRRRKWPTSGWSESRVILFS